jgi:hypothetical protein
MFRNMIFSGLVVILRGADASADQLASKLWVSNYVAQVLSTTAPGGIAGAYVSSWNTLTGSVTFAEADTLALAALAGYAATNAPSILWSEDGTRGLDATGGVWQVVQVPSAASNWVFAAAYGGDSGTAVLTDLPYPLADTFFYTVTNFFWSQITIDCTSEEPYDHYTGVTFLDNYSTLWGTTVPTVGFDLAEGGTTARLYRANAGWTSVTQRVDGVVFSSGYAPGVSASTVTGIVSAATNGLGSGTSAATISTATATVVNVSAPGTLYLDLTGWAATSSTWSASASWVVTPILTVTGRYEFAFVDLGGGRYRGRQVWPVCVSCLPRVESPYVTGTSAGNSAFTYGFQTLIAAANTNGMLNFRLPDPTVPYIARLTMNAAAGASATNTMYAYHGLWVTGQAEYTSTNLALTIVAASGSGAQRWLTKWFSVPPAAELWGSVGDEALAIRNLLHVRRFNATAGDVSVQGLDYRPMNELERAAYSAGWRP